MKFSNLALKGWSYEKGDKELDVRDLDLSQSILNKNPVQSTFVYSDESIWEERLHYHVRKVSEETGIPGTDIQAIFGVHNGYQKHPEGAGPASMTAIDARNAFFVEMTNGCSSVIIAAQMAGLHLHESRINNILVSSVQLTTQYTNNCTDGNCVFADSIGALIFSRAKSGNMVKYTDIQSNSYFSDMFLMDDNGLYRMANYQKGKELSKYMVDSFGKQMMQGCRTMKTYPSDLDFIAISASNYAATKMVLDNVNFPIERTGIHCLTETPHMGTNDLMAQLEYGIEQGMIKKGSKILVSGTSLGFSIATMAIEWDN